MSIVLNETEWAKNAIETHQLGKAPYETIRRVARYYMDSGMQKSQIVSAIEEFVLSCDSNASLTKMDGMIRSAITSAVKHEAVDIGVIRVTDAEMSAIKSITTGRQAERLAFVLLCLSKYWNAYNGSDTYWVNSKDSEIMQMANIKTSIKRQCKLYKDLKDAGLISFSWKVDCTNVKVNFANDDSDTILSIDDLRNLGNQYLMYVGEPYFVCAECGLVTKKNGASTGRKQKYCVDCAMSVKARKSSKKKHDDSVLLQNC